MRPIVLFAASLPFLEADSGGRWDAEADAVLRDMERKEKSLLSGWAPKQIVRKGDGVVYAMGGSVDFVAQEVLPTLRYLDRLGPKPASIQYALFAERRLLSKLSSKDSRAIHSWFDSITNYESVALPPFRQNRALSHIRVRVKAIKAHAFLFCPFERFVFMDFDSRPCSSNFAVALFEKLRKSRVDALLHNQWEEQQNRMDGEDHYAIEHNSAVAVWDATTFASDAALRFFVSAFERMKPRRDQPPLMVALRAAKRYANFTHADISTADFCRRNASRIVSCDAGCLVVHKPQKYDPGAVVFGIGSPDVRGVGSEPQLLVEVLAALKIVNKGEHCGNLPDSSDVSLACRVFPRPPYQQAHNLAQQWPRAKFVQVIDTACGDGLSTSAQKGEQLDRRRIFVLDLRQAEEDDGRTWKHLCSFLEVWSSCKTTLLSSIARKRSC